tara:strand:- start:2498 stop:2707 length:210 start_codon:yes stop_codon:yes gene_type:complete
MKLYSEHEEDIMYYERGDKVYQLVECKEPEGPSFFVVRDKEDKPLLASIDRSPAMTFFIYKCKKAEDEE